MKTGIITLSGSNNYGNVLQNYAVQEILNSLGCESETIHNVTAYGHYNKNEKVAKLTPSYIKLYIKNQLNYRFNIKNTGDGLFRQILFYKNNKELIEKIKKNRTDNFKKFCSSNIKYSKIKIDINNINFDEIAKFDLFVSGSDQVWNPTYPEVSMINFLNFAPEYKRLTFSPSFGVSEIPAYLKEDYAQWLSGIPYLSVREEQGKNIISDLTGRDSKVLLDPTLILPKEKWEAIEIKPDNIDEKEEYIFTYYLGDRTKEYKRFVENIALKNDLRVINLFDINDLENYAASPENFVYLIHHAKLICTDSFHGAAFSIIFHKNFITFPRVESGRSMGSRITTLLSKFHLETRDYRKVNENEIFAANHCQTQSIVDLERDTACNFLKSGIDYARKNAVECKTPYLGDNGCCGCSACENACPMNCITLEYDKEGFKYPVVDYDKCIHCNKCFKVCPVENIDFDSYPSKEKAYAAYSLNKETRQNSSSGGIFKEIASHIINQGGVVFAVGFDENHRVVNKYSETIDDLNNLLGSKYVQSDMNNTYTRVKEFLNAGRLVYFSGTPCQVEGLKKYLNSKDYPNLVTQNIICHGVPSPKLWQDYISYLNIDNISKISFRDKTYGWHYFSMRIQSDKKNYCKRLDEDTWLRLFLENINLRPICYECPFKNDHVFADFTLADCWGSDRLVKGIPDTDEGISLTFVKSEKAENIWNDIISNNKIKAENIDLSKAKKSQSAIYNSVNKNPKRAIFFEIYAKYGIEELCKVFFKERYDRVLRRKIIFIKTKIYKLIRK